MKRPTAIAVSLAAALFALTVWPTPYRYEPTKYGSTLTTTRINRVTGEAYILDPRSGWIRRGAPGEVKVRAHVPGPVPTMRPGNTFAHLIP